jgi:cytochrome c oxidase assembly protein subunit 15
MSNQQILSKWLWINIGMLVCLMILGGITRLEDAGLSIVEWAPFMGTLPPFTEMDWVSLFNQYKTSPEFQKINFMMTLGEFKYIFWLEYLHRLWGRFFGIIFFLPAFYFWIKGWLTSRQKNQIRILTVLGIAQAFMGWYMVKSGLIDDPHVSHFRLAAHFYLALAILGVLLWMVFDRWHSNPLRLNIWVLGPITDIAWLTILYGAFVAGLDAGLLYNDTFPHMGNALIPPDFFGTGGFVYNIFNNPVAIQCIHRWLAMLTGILVLFLAWKVRNQNQKLANLLVLAVFLQIALGITTLFTNVNTWIAEAHQLGAVFLFSLFTYVWHCRLKASA